MVKKSAAQLRRSQRRAEGRGETYQPPINATLVTTSNANVDKLHDDGDNHATHDQEKPNVVFGMLSSHQIKMRSKAGKQLTDEMFAIAKNTQLNAKERRSAKRKAEVLAAELAGCTASDLIDWYNKNQKDIESSSSAADDLVIKKDSKSRAIPYTAFIGQLSYETSSEDLFQHIQSELKNDKDFNTTISKDKIKIRLLTDSKTSKSRGMAFVEVTDPETLYALLKLHHTYLKGRRINVERTAGGGSESRKSKINTYRKEQEQYIKDTVQSILQEYYARGEIQKEGELDDGVIALCSRHSAAIVEAALERYVDSNGRDMDNSSAYLSFLLGKLASEGVYKSKDDETNKKPSDRQGSKRDAKNKTNTRNNHQPLIKRPRLSKDA
jgi:RNA recognition motif-containing protein